MLLNFVKYKFCNINVNIINCITEPQLTTINWKTKTIKRVKNILNYSRILSFTKNQTGYRKRKPRRFSLIGLPFAHCPRGKFVVCPFVDEETIGSYPFANGLNGLPIYGQGDIFLSIRPSHFLKTEDGNLGLASPTDYCYHSLVVFKLIFLPEYFKLFFSSSECSFFPFLFCYEISFQLCTPFPWNKLPRFPSWSNIYFPN